MNHLKIALTVHYRSELLYPSRHLAVYGWDDLPLPIETSIQRIKLNY